MTSTDHGALQPPRLELFQTKLDNGLTVVIQRDEATVLAAVNLWYQVGSRDERPDRTGFAHLFEHMMFQGSAHVKANEHFAFMEKVGASLNATTSIDRTNYFESLPVEHLDLALWLEADRMGSLDVSQENLDNQREVVKEEKRQRYDNQPAGTFFPDVVAALFPEGHPYHHAPIGSMEHLDAADLDYVQAFHRTYYGPNTAVLTVVSPLPVEDVLRRVTRFFGGITPIDPPPPMRDASVAQWKLDAPVRQDRPDRVQTPIVGIGWRIPPYGHPDHDAAQLALTVLGSGRGSRLARALTRDRELVVPASSYVQGLSLDKGASIAVGQVMCRPEVTPDEVADAIAHECARLVAEPPTDAEIQRAKALSSSGWLDALAGVASRADEIGRVTTKTGSAEQINNELDALLAAHVDDVVRVADETLSFDANLVVNYLPSASEEVAA